MSTAKQATALPVAKTLIGPPGTGKLVSAQATAVHELLLTHVQTNAASYAATAAADSTAIN